MKPTSVYSVRLDDKVILIMLIIIGSSLFFTAFRYKNYEPCRAFQFSVYANYFNVGHYIFFKTTDTYNAQKWEWDFGDKTPVDKTSGPVVSHVYTQPGQYIVSLTINGKCKQYQNIVINNVVKDSIRFVMPQVIWPANPVITGQNIVFRDVTNGAHSWEWYIGEGKDSKRFVTRDVIYTFTSPGLVPVKLFVNGNIDAKEERLIEVKSPDQPKYNTPVVSGGGYNKPVYRPQKKIKDRPDNESILDDNSLNKSEAPVVIQAPQLTKEYFLQMIRGVVDGSVNERDFEPYLCGNRNVRVSYNGDDISFSECISRLQKVKKVKSLKASAYTDSGTNCILSISIVLEKKTFLGI